MRLTHLPLLSIQRDLYRLPRGAERFHAYLWRLRDPRTGDLALPIVAMNPMGKEHVPESLDRWIAAGAEEAAANAIGEASAALAAEPGEYQVALVACDDWKGGWTNRASTDFGQRFRPHALTRRGFVTVLLWTSESWNAERVYRETTLAVHRIAWIQRHGEPRTLRSMLEQEGAVQVAAGMHAPSLDRATLERTRAVVAPLLDRDDMPTCIAALFGDDAAASLGFATLGLPKDAGLELALDDALSSAASTRRRGRRPRP